jgi:hypothetical protein
MVEIAHPRKTRGRTTFKFTALTTQFPYGMDSSYSSFVQIAVNPQIFATLAD